MEPERLSAGEELLREAVYRSRERQAALTALRADPVETAGCGLGERAAVVLDLSPRAGEIYARLFPADLGERALQGIRSVLSEWIERQDALDRKRNHFLKEFRRRHGFDRASYSPQVLSDFESGLERIGAEEDSERRSAAGRLLAIEG